MLRHLQENAFYDRVHARNGCVIFSNYTWLSSGYFVMPPFWQRLLLSLSPVLYAAALLQWYTAMTVTPPYNCILSKHHFPDEMDVNNSV